MCPKEDHGEKMDKEVREFLELYETARMSADGSAVAALYADSFVFGGAKGTQTVRREDLAKAVPQMKSHFAAMGLSETHLKSAGATVLDSRYVLVKVGWTMSIRAPGRAIQQVEAFA